MTAFKNWGLLTIEDYLAREEMSEERHEDLGRVVSALVDFCDRAELIS